MAEMILPGVYIEVRPEGLIIPGRVTVGNLGVVGTASKGEIGKPIVLGSYAQAREVFGSYDAWINGESNELTLVRALELAYAHGATTVIAVRVASGAKKSEYRVKSASGDSVLLTAKSEGTWGDALSINIFNATEDAFVEDESHNGGAAITLSRNPVVKNARNRILVNGKLPKIIYDDVADAPAPGEIKVNRATGAITFATGEEPTATDKILANYMVDKSNAVKVTLRFGRAEEVYTVVDSKDLIRDIKKDSVWVDAQLIDHENEAPVKSTKADAFASFRGGDDGATGANYIAGLEKLLDQDVQIVLAAGQDDSFGDELDAHCQVASSDSIKRDRIAVVGSKSDTLETVTSHTLASDRVILVAPGIKFTDTAATPPTEVSLTGSYAAAAIAGLLAGLSPHISSTNKTLRVGSLSKSYTDAELSQLVQSRVLALEIRQGIRVVKGITTSTNTAWRQITTRRIVDYAKYGVRSAANSYIGLLNNDRVRGALRATINSFLSEMVTDEMLVRYDLTVTATREQERQGIVQVTMTLQPTFSIDFIKVTMFLE